jgi:hypothetical protein
MSFQKKIVQKKLKISPFFDRSRVENVRFL